MDESSEMKWQTHDFEITYWCSLYMLQNYLQEVTTGTPSTCLQLEDGDDNLLLEANLAEYQPPSSHREDQLLEIAGQLLPTT